MVPTLTSLLDDALNASKRAEHVIALALADRAELLAAHLKDVQGQARALYIRSRALYNLGDYTVVIPQLIQASELAASVGDLHTQIEAMEYLAHTQRALGDVTAALDASLRSLSLAEKSGDPVRIAGALNATAGIYMVMDDPRTALMYCERALGLHQQSGNRSGEAVLMGNISNLLSQLEDFRGALEYAKTSWQILNEIGLGEAPPSEINALIRLAQAESGLDKWADSFEHLQQALVRAQEFQMIGFQVDILQHMAQLYVMQGMRNDALPLYEQAVEIATQHRLAKRYHKLFLYLSHLHKENGAYQQALAYHEQYVNYHEEIFNEQSAQRARQLEARYQNTAAKREAEIARQQVDLYRQFAEQSEQQRHIDRAYFDRLNELRDDLINTISHDVKNPLSSIRIAVYLLRRQMPETDERWFNNIEVQVMRLQTMLSDVFELVKLESGRALNLSPQPVVPLMREVFDRFAAEARSQQVEMVFGNADPSLIAQCDPVRVTQALHNLVANSLKYAPQGSKITLMADRVRWEDTPMIRISVHDMGVYIEPEHQDHIFDRFHRDPNPDGQGNDGTGLGLAIVKSIVEQHHGHAWVESEPDRGAMFCFTLPVG